MIENERVCSKTFEIKTREWICPEDKNLVAEINASPQVPGDPVLVLAGTPGSVICKNIVKNGNETRIGANGNMVLTRDDITVNPIDLFINKGEYNIACEFDYGGMPYSCNRKVKALFPICEVVTKVEPEKAPSSLDVKINIKDEDGTKIPQSLMPNIVAYPVCNATSEN